MILRTLLASAACMAGQPPAASLPTRPTAVPAPHADGPGEDARFLARLQAVDAAMARVADLRADFVQTRHTPLLKKPLVSTGVVLTKGDQARWDTATPRASSLRIGPRAIRIYYPADQLVEEYPVDEGFKHLAGTPLPRLSVLRANFEITRLEPKDVDASRANLPLLALQLTPTSERVRSHLASVRVLIDESVPSATMIVLTDADGEVTRIEFRNVTLNRGVRDEEIDPKLPAGVRVSRPLGEPIPPARKGASR